MTFENRYIMTEEHKRKIGETNRKIIQEKVKKGEYTSNMLGKHHTEEAKRKISEFYKGKFKIQIDKEILNELYINQRKTAFECANYFNCSEGCIVRRLKYYNIKQRTQSECKKGDLNPTYGKIAHNFGIPPSKDQIEKQSKTMKRLYEEGKIINPRKGKKANEETIIKLRKSHLEYYKLHSEVKELMKERRKYLVLPFKDSSIEVKIQNFLKKLGIEYFTHQYIKDIEHGYQCDILIPSINLVIECDGDYWHKYPIGNDLDHIRTQELLDNGFKVLRLWENEIKVLDIDTFKNKLNSLTGLD